MRCNLCPRRCNVRRGEGELGYCKSPWEITAARAALHMWEEPVLSGTGGSGTVFFSGCSLGCVFCQNQSIASGETARSISSERLTELFFMLEEKGAHNINLVTGSHYVPQIVRALERAKLQGLSIPVVYNTGSYEKVSALKLLDGLVDIYLPDLKYKSAALAARYANAPDYFEYASAAIAEMIRQVGMPILVPYVNRNSTEHVDIQKMEQSLFECGDDRKSNREQLIGISGSENEKCLEMEHNSSDTDMEDEENMLMKKGVIVRHLLLPGQLEDSKAVIRYLHETWGDQIYISIMNQYTPCNDLPGFPELQRKVTEKEYEELIDYAIDLGVEQGFIQEGETAEESFIPAFDYEGL